MDTLYLILVVSICLVIIMLLISLFCNGKNSTEEKFAGKNKANQIAMNKNTANLLAVTKNVNPITTLIYQLASKNNVSLSDSTLTSITSKLSRGSKSQGDNIAKLYQSIAGSIASKCDFPGGSQASANAYCKNGGHFAPDYCKCSCNVAQTAWDSDESKPYKPCTKCATDFKTLYCQTGGDHLAFASPETCNCVCSQGHTTNEAGVCVVCPGKCSSKYDPEGHNLGDSHNCECVCKYGDLGPGGICNKCNPQKYTSYCQGKKPYRDPKAKSDKNCNCICDINMQLTPSSPCSIRPTFDASKPIYAFAFFNQDMNKPETGIWKTRIPVILRFDPVGWDSKFIYKYRASGTYGITYGNSDNFVSYDTMNTPYLMINGITGNIKKVGVSSWHANCSYSEPWYEFLEDIFNFIKHLFEALGQLIRDIGDTIDEVAQIISGDVVGAVLNGLEIYQDVKDTIGVTENLIGDIKKFSGYDAKDAIANNIKALMKTGAGHFHRITGGVAKYTVDYSKLSDGGNSCLGAAHEISPLSSGDPRHDNAIPYLSLWLLPQEKGKIKGKNYESGWAKQAMKFECILENDAKAIWNEIGKLPGVQKIFGNSYKDLRGVDNISNKVGDYIDMLRKAIKQAGYSEPNCLLPDFLLN